MISQNALLGQMSRAEDKSYGILGTLHFNVVTVSKCFPSVGFGRFCRKNLGFRFGLGFHDKRTVNFFMTRVIWHDFHHH